MDTNKIDEFNNILSGCRTILDAKWFEQLYIKDNPEMEKIVISMVNGKRYENILDFATIKNTLIEINECRYKHEARNIIENITENEEYVSYDNLQLRALSRLANSKPYKPVNSTVTNFKEIEVSLVKNYTIVKQSCPHCGLLNSACVEDNMSIDYAICGYTSGDGFDWKGCGRDFCFRCGKMFCKSWMDDKLFVFKNRHHDNQCCRNHAKVNNKSYPDDYCQCYDRSVIIE